MSYTINIINDTTSQVVRTFNLSDAQILALKSRIAGDIGVLKFVAGALQGKIEKCVKLMRKQWTDILIAEETLPPANDEAFVTLITARPDYKDREQQIIDSGEEVPPD